MRCSEERDCDIRDCARKYSAFSRIFKAMQMRLYENGRIR